jgi:hypothetical protein
MILMIFLVKIGSGTHWFLSDCAKHESLAPRKID